MKADMTYTDFVWSIFERMQGEIAGQIRVLLGEAAYDQRIFTDAERARRVEAMKTCATENTGDEERHKSWCEMHFQSGWKLGPEFDPSKKEHPNLVPWKQLPASAKVKAKIFDIVAKHASTLVSTSMCTDLARASILARFPITTRSTACALTKLDECEMWLQRAGQEATAGQAKPSAA